MIDLAKMSILVVDDMKSMRLTIRKMLKHLEIGKKLRYAADGKEGLNLLSNNPADLAIVDWRMPVMNGIELLKKIRANKFLRDMPVIMVTAEAEKHIVSEVAETEIDAYLLKPLTLESLDRKIRYVVNKANNPDQATIHLRQARDSEEKEDYDTAIEQTRLALRYKPGASRILRNLGMLHFKIDKDQIGIKCLQKAASVNREDAVTRYILGDIFRKKGDLASAAKYYQQMLAISDQYISQAIDLAEQLLENSRTNYAIDLFDQVVNRHSKNLSSRERIIDICIENHELDYAENLLKNMIKEFPKKFDMVYKLALVYMNKDDIANALDLFLAVDENEYNHVESKLNIAKIYFNSNKFIVADRYINDVLRIDPENIEALEMRKHI